MQFLLRVFLRLDVHDAGSSELSGCQLVIEKVESAIQILLAVSHMMCDHWTPAASHRVGFGLG
jgi:hypothetical protein